MGTRERWVDDEEAEANGRVAAAVLKSVRDTPGVIVSGKPHRWTSVVIHLQYRIPPFRREMSESERFRRRRLD